MDTAWIQIFVLTFAECVAPAGKTVCQQQQFELQFLTRSDCEYALQQLLTKKSVAHDVIVDRNRSKCTPSAVEREAFDSLEAISKAHSDIVDWKSPGPGGVALEESDNASGGHRKRLQELKSCDETNGVAPCKSGNIIVEETSKDNVEVWKRN